MATTAPPQEPQERPDIAPGCLPDWGTAAEIPAPPPFNLRNALRLIGPAAIALGTSIGAGEWLVGPSVTAKYGAALLWIASISILLQIVLNQEIMRYTLATGEPIFTGFLRTKPGPLFWGPFYTILLLLQIGWPGIALSAATSIAAAFKGSMTTAADKPMILFWGVVVSVACLVIVALGGKVERSLERAQWFMIAWIFIFLVGVGVFFTSGEVWGKVARGFVGQGGRPIPQSGDWMLLASFAAIAGMGGLGNGTLSNWVRDKGWGMASTVGYIPGLVGGRVVPLSQVGNVFPLTTENRRRFAEWFRYARFEQFWIFGIGCFLGMGLPALITLQFVPPNADITGEWATSVYQAQGLGKALGPIAWFLTLLNGFWILFSTQLGNTDIFARTVTDMLWSTHPGIRALARQDVRRVYFAVIGGYAFFGMAVIAAMVLSNLAKPGFLVVLGAFIAAFNFAVLGSHTIYVQWRFLPKELRMSAWRTAALVVFVLMFTGFTYMGIQSEIHKILAAKN